MPTYEYRCEKCEHEFEREQRISDPPIKTCPACRSRKVKKLISRTSFVLKGGGWYSDLYSSPQGKPESSASGKDATNTSDATGAGSSSAASSGDSSASGSDAKRSDKTGQSDKSSKSGKAGKTAGKKSAA